MVGGAAAFCGYHVREIGGREFIDDADEAFKPGVFVVFWRRRDGVGEEGGFFCQQGGGEGEKGAGVVVVAVRVLVADAAVCKAWL